LSRFQKFLNPVRQKPIHEKVGGGGEKKGEEAEYKGSADKSSGGGAEIEQVLEKARE